MKWLCINNLWWWEVEIKTYPKSDFKVTKAFISNNLVNNLEGRQVGYRINLGHRASRNIGLIRWIGLHSDAMRYSWSVASNWCRQIMTPERFFVMCSAAVRASTYESVVHLTLTLRLTVPECLSWDRPVLNLLLVSVFISTSAPSSANCYKKRLLAGVGDMRLEKVKQSS
jgi:hypothetical protein